MRSLITLIVLVFVVGCATVPQGISPAAKPLVNKKGRTNTYEILGQSQGSASHFSLLGFIPFGRADIDEAIQKAITSLNGDNLINTHYYVTNTWLLIGFSTKITVKGDVVKYTGISALNKTQQSQVDTQQHQKIKNKDAVSAGDKDVTIKQQRYENTSSTNSFKKSLFQIGKNYIGPSLGLAFQGVTVSFGANYEIRMNLKNLGVDAPGILGVGGIFRYWSYDEGLYGSYTDIVIAAQGNYHIILDNEKLDPYVGVLLGYDFGSYSFSYPRDYGGFYRDSWDYSGVGGLVLGVSGGARYWVSSQMAVNARLGVGTNMGAILDVGVDFKF